MHNFFLVYVLILFPLPLLLLGASLGDCPVSNLRSLLKSLQIDLSKLNNASSSSENGIFPDVDLPAIALTKSSLPKKVASGNLLKIKNDNLLKRTPSNDEEEDEAVADDDEGVSNEDDESKDGPPAAEEDEDTSMNDEMLEVTPDVSEMFLGNHFLSSMENGDEGSSGPPDGADEGTVDEEEEEEPAAAVAPAAASTVGGANGNSYLEQSMARHKELKEMMMRNGGMMFDNGGGEEADGRSGGYSGGGGGGGGRMSAGGGGGGGDYTCRLCGKSSGNGASLFAHLLYPHYAHLWRTDVPHRAQRYDCKHCPYTTVKRQHFVMHVARVHDELKKKLTEMGENLAVLDNLTQKHQNHNRKERIVSKIAKMISESDGAPTAAGHDNRDASFGGNGNGSDLPRSAAANSPSESFGDYSAAASTSAAGNNSFSTPKFGGASSSSPFDYSAHMAATRYPRGIKPFVKCRMCGKSWKGKDNFFTHLVSTHFKYLWAAEVPRQADMFFCHVPGCSYQSKYRYNFLFHLAGKHKQLKQKLSEEGIPPDVLVPIEMDSSEMEEHQAEQMAAGAAAASGMMSASDLLKHSKMLSQHRQQQQELQQRQQQQQQQHASLMTTPPSAVKGSHSPLSSTPHSGSGAKQSQNNTRLICRVCQKVSLNHTCHRQHVVGKHFQEFWAHLIPDGMGIFNCHHIDCTYKTPNRSVFVIHLAYVHQELKTKLINSGRDPSCATPDVYGKRKYRKAFYDNTQYGLSGMAANMEFAGAAAAAAAAASSSPSFGGASSSASEAAAAAAGGNPAEAMATLMMSMMSGGKNLNSTQQEALKQIFAAGAAAGSNSAAGASGVSVVDDDAYGVEDMGVDPSQQGSSDPSHADESMEPPDPNSTNGFDVGDMELTGEVLG
jgi:hypothetical protein